MINSVVLLIMIVSTVTAFLPYSFLTNDAALLSLTQQAVAQGDSALEKSSDDAQSADNGAEPTGGAGGPEGPSDGTELTDGGTEGPSDGGEEESALIPDDTRQDFDEFECQAPPGDPGSGTCSCSGIGDCVNMVLAGQCKEGTFRETGSGGECDWNV
jgi:hypothetical protein